MWKPSFHFSLASRTNNLYLLNSYAMTYFVINCINHKESVAVLNVSCIKDPNTYIEINWWLATSLHHLMAPLDQLFPCCRLSHVWLSNKMWGLKKKKTALCCNASVRWLLNHKRHLWIKWCVGVRHKQTKAVFLKHVSSYHMITCPGFRRADESSF